MIGVVIGYDGDGLPITAYGRRDWLARPTSSPRGLAIERAARRVVAGTSRTWPDPLLVNVPGDLMAALADALDLPECAAISLPPVADDTYAIHNETGEALTRNHARALMDAPPTGEVRATDPATGAQKGRKLAELGAIDLTALLRVAEVAGYGGRKYERGNYLKGYAWSWSFDALMRHLLAFWSGENVDPESGLPHMAHASWHTLALLAFTEHGLGTDDRITF